MAIQSLRQNDDFLYLANLWTDFDPYALKLTPSPTLSLYQRLNGMGSSDPYLEIWPKFFVITTKKSELISVSTTR